MSGLKALLLRSTCHVSDTEFLKTLLLTNLNEHSSGESMTHITIVLLGFNFLDFKNFAQKASALHVCGRIFPVAAFNQPKIPYWRI